MIAMIGGGEWWILILIALILFGGKRLPELARALGKSVQEFKKGMAGIEDEINRPVENPADADANKIEPPKAS